jgi:hypothetical protein
MESIAQIRVQEDIQRQPNVYIKVEIFMWPVIGRLRVPDVTTETSGSVQLDN